MKSSAFEVLEGVACNSKVEAWIFMFEKTGIFCKMVLSQEWLQCLTSYFLSFPGKVPRKLKISIWLHQETLISELQTESSHYFAPKKVENYL